MDFRRKTYYGQEHHRQIYAVSAVGGSRTAQSKMD